MHPAMPAPCRYPRTGPQASTDVNLDLACNGPHNDGENLEDDPEHSDTKDNPRNGHVSLPKVARQRATE